MSVNHLAALIVSADRGSVMVNLDVKKAYRKVPDDQHLFGITPNGLVCRSNCPPAYVNLPHHAQNFLPAQILCNYL